MNRPGSRTADYRQERHGNRTAGQGLRPAADVLRSAARLGGRAEAEYLLMSLLGVPRHKLYIGAQVSDRAASRFFRLLRRARAGEPVQYLAGRASFLDFDIAVDPRVLIPRPETEELVTRVVARVQAGQGERDAGRELLLGDYGTGSGCIAIALARAFPEARVWAVDAGADALAVAQQNIAGFGFNDRIRLIQAADFDHPELARLKGRLDLLVSNPPYVPTPRLPKLAPEVRREPALALDGGPEGARIVAMLLMRGPELLRQGGLLAIELDATHYPLVLRLAPSAKVERDLSGRVRYAFLEK